MPTKTADPNTLTLKRVDHATSKAEEISALEALSMFYRDSQAYITDFLDPRAVEWARRQILQDAPPNLYEQWQHTETQLSVDAIMYTERIAERERDLKDARRDRDNSQAALLHREEIHARYTEQTDLTRNNLRAEVEDLSNQRNQLQCEKATADVIIQNQNAEIIRLKARLWDFIEKLSSK